MTGIQPVTMQEGAVLLAQLSGTGILVCHSSLGRKFK